MKAKAFTLIELLVVITIVGLIMLTAFYTLGRSAQQVKLQMTVEQVASNLRFEQTQVKTGVAPEVGVQPLCRGYAFSVGEGAYTPVLGGYNSIDCDDVLPAEQSLFFAAGVEVSSITDSNEGSLTELMILFEPPLGTVQFLDESGAPLGIASVDLTFAYTLSDYPVDGILTVNRSGQINFKYQ